MTFLVSLAAKSQLKPLEKITEITFIWKHKDKRQDFDNVEFAQKFIRDGLVHAGIVKNDSWAFFPPKTTHYHEVDRTHPGVIVLLQ